MKPTAIIRNKIGKISVLVWLFIIIYSASNLIFSSIDTPKELLDKYPATYEEILTEWQNSTTIEIKNRLLPLWRYNRFIYPPIIVFAVFLGLVAARKAKSGGSI